MAANPTKRILAECGFAISRVAPAARTRAAEQRDTRGKLIEFAGPSGIGKSSLLHQVIPELRRDWFFEHHAKGLLGEIPETAEHADYLRQICARRLADLMTLDLPFERIASIGQRALEVARLGMVSKSVELPRGFIMDDGIAHFFAEQIIAMDRDATKEFLGESAFIFLMPNQAETLNADAAWTPEVLEVYHKLHELVCDLGCQTLLLERGNRAENPEKILSFIRQLSTGKN